MERGIPPLPPPIPRGLGAGGAVQECRPLRPPRPGARSPPPPPCRGRPVAPRVLSGKALPGFRRRGEAQQRGLKWREQRGALPRSPKSHRHRCAHTGQLHRTGVCGERGTSSQVSKGRVGTILVLSPSPSALLPGAHVPGSRRCVYPGGPDGAPFEARGSKSSPRGLY